MSTAVQRRRGTTAQHSSFAGLEGELTVDTTKDTLVVHDGATAGGRPLLREDQTNLPSSVANGIYAPSANNVAISTNGTGRLFVDSSGRLGLGTSAPDSNLEIVNATGSADNNLLKLHSSTATSSANLILEVNNGNTAQAALKLDTANKLHLQTYGSGALNNRLSIDGDGKVGIGTNPEQILHIKAASQAPNDNGGLMLQHTTAAATANTGLPLVWSGYGSPSYTNYTFASICGRKESGTSADFSGYLQFATGNWAGAVTEKARITSDGKLGVGTSNPSSKLGVVETTAAEALRIDGAAGGFALVVNGGSARSTAIKQAAIGNSYVGTTPPTDGLIVQGSVGIGTTTVDSGKVQIKQSGTTYQSGLAITNPADDSYLSLWGSGSSFNVESIWNSTGSYKDIAFRLSNTERARLTVAGQFLVGTSTSITSAGTSGGGAGSTPALQVVHPYQNINPAGISLSRFQASNPYGAVFTIQKSKSDAIGSHGIVDSGDELGVISFDGSNGTAFNTAATISAAVDGTPGANDMPGRLVFATTAAGASSPTERMRITNNGRIFAYANNTSGACLYVQSGQAAGTSETLIIGRNGATNNDSGTNSFLVYTNGNVENSNNSYGAISDIKLKENIVDANSQWDDLKALQVRNYNFKEGQTHTQIGLIAQEAELISPGLVSESPDRDEDGNDLGTVTKSVNYSVLYMKAVKALQEAMERIEVLEAKVNALEGN
jgi:hypothetical protein